MTRALDPALVEKAVALYVAGKTGPQVATEVGISLSTLSRELQARGIKTRGLRRNDLPTEEVRLRYQGGETEQSLAKVYAVDRSVIARLLREQAIPRRGLSEAMSLRYVGMTREERKAISAKANATMRGRPANPDQLRKAAKTRERRPFHRSAYEDTMAKWLCERNTTHIREKAIDKYNVDFAVGTVAVEILGGEWHTTRTKTLIHNQRTPYLLNAGWAVLFVWATTNCPLTSVAADYLVAYADETRRNPSLVGEYRVIRGDGQLLARGRREDYELTGIQPARHGLYPYSRN